ncbi:MAG: alkaline phosphatase family protein, partial [Candidatus Odinarchaeota archaeon]
MNLIKNIILGIDGGCFNHLEPLLKRNLLPNFKKIISNGFSSKLRVTIPPTTIPSWPCIFSGVTPNQLGMHYFDHPIKGLFNSSLWKNKAIFSNPTLRSFVLNVPGTFPPWNINGEMISGMLSPSLACVPQSLTEHIKDKWIVDGRDIPEVFKTFEIKKKIFLEKINKKFNLLIYVIRSPDVCSHLTVPKDPKEILKNIFISYIKIDRMLGEILEHEDIDNIIIVSDHGLKHYSRVIHMNRWLEKKGFLFLNKGGSKLFRSIFNKLFGIISTNLRFSFKLINMLKEKFNIPTEKIKHLGTTAAKVISQSPSNVGVLLLHGELALKKNSIETELKKERWVKNTFSIISERLTELFIVLQDNYLFSGLPSRFVKMRGDYIEHSQYGFFIANGKNFRTKEVDVINYFNIAPTVLKLFNIEKKEYMIGNS